VEYKIFGPGRQPADDFKENLAALCRLDGNQRDALAEWFLSARSYEPWEPELPPIIAASTLLPDQFRQAANIVRDLLYAWQRYGIELTDVERDLLLLGCSAQEMRIVLALLERLYPVKERVWIDVLKGYQEVAGLPTVDDVNIVWNARPVFGADAFSWPGDSDQTVYKRLFGLVHLAMIEINASDARGQKQRIAVQMTEASFERLLVSMKRAAEQLDTFKGCTKAFLGGETETLKEAK
jgi:hypothetical protein